MVRSQNCQVNGWKWWNNHFFMYRFGIIQLKQPIAKTFTLPETNIANAREKRHFAPKENESSEPTINLQGKNVSFGEGICVYVLYIYMYIPSPKLTVRPWKWMVGIRFLWGSAYFQGCWLLVSGSVYTWTFQFGCQMVPLQGVNSPSLRV